MINKIKSITGFKFQDSRFKTKGFTLVELLVVIGIIAILFAVVLVAINPAKRFAEANNARRLSDVNSILNATLNYTVDQKGSLPLGLQANTTATANYISATPRLIGTTDLAATTTTVTCSAGVGVGTCAVPGFGSCAANADCDNSCQKTTLKCKATGKACTCTDATSDGICDTLQGNNAECGVWVAPSVGVCVSSFCTNPGRIGTACASGTEIADCAITSIACTANVCVNGPFAGRYCDVVGECNSTVALATGGASACSVDTITAQKVYNLGSSAESIVPTYLATVPADPANSAATPKYYVISNVGGAGRIKVSACNPDDPQGDGYTDNKIEVIR